MSEPVLPATPEVELAVARERSADRSGFLQVVHYDLTLRVGNGPPSASFAYDVLDRRALDACVIAAHHVDAAGTRHVWLLSCVRPPLALRSDAASPVLWELAAGLIEPGEAARAAAARELAEELGFHVGEAALLPLGPPSAPAPGFVGELHHFFHVEVRPEERKPPQGDGSALEAAARVVAVPLARALDACRAGEIRDGKTELALRRLHEMLGGAR